MAATTEDMIADLKQFITAEIGHGTSDLKLEIAALRTELKSDIADLRHELKSDIADVDAKVDTILDTMGSEVVELQATASDHGKRLTKLEVARAV